MRIPKVGEYWYITCGVTTVLGKIQAVSDTTIVAYLPKYKESISYSTLCCDKDVKWEHNLFWKLLGYK